MTKKSSDWHPADVIAALHKRGLALRGLSRDHGFSVHTLRDALRRPYPKAEKIIAAALNTPPWKIWPSRYDATGRHLGGRAMKSITRRKPRNVQNRTAA